MPPGELGSGAAELETETTPGFGELGDGTSELRTGTYRMREEVVEGEAKARKAWAYCLRKHAKQGQVVLGTSYHLGRT